MHKGRKSDFRGTTFVDGFEYRGRPLTFLITAGAVRLVAVRSGMGEAGDKVNFLSLEIYSLVVSGSGSVPVVALFMKPPMRSTGERITLRIPRAARLVKNSGAERRG